MTYLARACFLLQQGKFVADLAYLLNEGAPSTPPIWAAGTRPTPPDGHDYDFINADVLLNRMSVTADGRLLLPDGMSYRVLVLPDTDRMRPALLRKIREFVHGGAIVVGRRPLRSPSLTGYPACDDEVRALALEIWGDLDGVSRTMRRFGQGTVVWGWPLDRVMAAQSIAKDFEYGRALDAEVAWTHRRIDADDTDLYYVANLTDRAQEFAARFRVTGREAGIWRPSTGAIEPAGYMIDQERTTVPLQLAEREAVFVVFRRAASAPARTVPRAASTTLAILDGAWEVRFPGNLGAPARVPFAQLASWTANAEEGVKFFSGTAKASRRPGPQVRRITVETITVESK